VKTTHSSIGASAEVPDCRGKRFALVVARFYDQLATWMVDGARRGLIDCGVSPDDIRTIDVPGCFEIPLACDTILSTGEYAGAVALGVVVRGETPHFDYVAGECSRGVMDVSLAHGLPIGFGILTTDSYLQAEERADPSRGDKGYHAAIAAATLAALAATISAETDGRA
jgi:6,7-dimethyl-8-ribityllumazine synthase